MVESAQQSFATDLSGMDQARASFRLYAIVRAMRYLVVSTIQSEIKFRAVWFQTGILGGLVKILADRNGPIYYHPLTVSLVVDTTLWLIKGNTKNGECCKSRQKPLKLRYCGVLIRHSPFPFNTCSTYGTGQWW